MAQDLLGNTTLCWTYCETMMPPQLSQFINWPCRSESVPQNRYLHQSNMVQEKGNLTLFFIIIINFKNLAAHTLLLCRRNL